MAYRQENKEIVIDGWENGIADSPYQGISDIRNMNLISVPKEASVNFATTQNSALSITTGVVASASAGGDTINYVGTVGTPTSGMAIVFAGGSLPSGITAGTQAATSDTNVYWISNIDINAQTFKVYTNPGLSSLVDITSSGTGTFTTIDMGQPRFSATTSASVQYIVDHNGRVWYSNGTTWIFVNNTTRANANGNGLVYYQASNGTGYLFVFRNALIDYMPTASIGTWTYGWKTLNTAAGTPNSHQAIVGFDNVVYYCDANYIGRFFEVINGPPQTNYFDPTSAGTYTFSSQAVAISAIEIAQCVAELGNLIIIAGTRNLLYPWDRIKTNCNYPVFIADTFGLVSMGAANGTALKLNLPRILTINTNAYIFMGVRGRIYITNGTQAQLYKKLPDHLSGTIEPYYTWGGVGFNKNQLYFGVIVTTNGAATNSNYGGLWAIDLDTKALRIVNQLSYGSYAGFCTLIIPLTGTATAGSGFYVGWDSGSSTYGMDISSGTSYTNYQSYIDTDNIPIGTLLKPTTSNNLEWKLATPLVSGEGIKISYRLKFSDSFTLIWENTTVGAFSDYQAVNFQNAQWVQFRIETKSTASSPSYVRLTELRLR